MMTAKMLQAQEVASCAGPTGATRLVARLACLASLAILVPACQDKVSVPPVEVQVVEAYGLRLDESAGPEQVVYVLLRSMREDFEAAQAHDHERQRKAFEVTFSLAAFTAIEKQILAATGTGAASQNADLGETRAQKLHNIIYHWTPIASHYVRSFDEDPAVLAPRMRVVPVAGETDHLHVYVDVAHDPQNPDPAERGPAVLGIRLAREKATTGPETYWRVARLAFVGPKAGGRSRESATQQASE